MDAVFDSVAADEPAFAGSYLGPDGRMVLNVARGGVLRNVSHVIEGVAPLRRRSELGRPEFLMSSMDAPTVQTVDYTWKELIEAKDKVLQLPDDRALSSVDADERLNRVVVGVVAAAETTSVRAALRQAGVADGIARLEVQPRAEEHHDLNARLRPIGGGLNIGRERNDGKVGECTAALVASWNGVPVLLTNSHCSSIQNALDGGRIAQPAGWRVSVWDYIRNDRFWGREVFDIGRYGCGWDWYRTKWCRRADLAAYALWGVDIEDGETQWRQGIIYRPAERVPGNQSRPGTTSIDQASPHFTVVGEVARVQVGLTLERVGRTTGWKTGPVTSTCADRRTTEGWLVCQSEATLNSQPGDSGGPVFILQESGRVLFAGINWGKTDKTPNAFFSDVTQMRQEMGPSLVFTP